MLTYRTRLKQRRSEVRKERYILAQEVFIAAGKRFKLNPLQKRILVEVLPDKWRWFNTGSAFWYSGKGRVYGNAKSFLAWHAKHTKITDTNYEDGTPA